MRNFELKILTPTGEAFSGEVSELFVRTTAGEVGILAGHTDYLAGIVPCVVKMTDGEGKERMAFCGGGFLSVVSGVMNLVVDELIFSEAIDAEKVRLERDRLASEFSACDAKKQPERAEFLNSSLARVEVKLKACE